MSREKGESCTQSNHLRLSHLFNRQTPISPTQRMLVVVTIYYIHHLRLHHLNYTIQGYVTLLSTYTLVLILFLPSHCRKFTSLRVSELLCDRPQCWCVSVWILVLSGDSRLRIPDYAGNRLIKYGFHNYSFQEIVHKY